MSVRLVVQPNLCTGCRSCELACAFTHGAGGSPGASRCVTLTVGKDEYVPMFCLQCDNAACAKVCPVDAITMDEKRRVLVLDYAKCVHCMACTVACPFGNMHFDASHSLVHKCDLCTGHGDVPRCALFCPSKCLTVETLADPPARTPAVSGDAVTG
jgi:Fe-S-cluster-containing hydrogenase component 2